MTFFVKKSIYVFVDFGVGFWLDFGWVRGVLTLNPTRWGRVGLRFWPSRVGPQINPFWIHFGRPWTCKIVFKRQRKIDKKRNVFFIDFWKDFGCQMRSLWEPKARLKIDVFLDVFLNASGNIDRASTGPRRVLEWYTFSSRTPWAAPLYQRIPYNTIKEGLEHAL